MSMHGPDDDSDDTSTSPTTESLLAIQKGNWQRGVQCLPLLGVIRYFEKHSDPSSTVHWSASTSVYNPRILLWKEVLGAGAEAEVKIITSIGPRPLARKQFMGKNRAMSPKNVYKELAVLAYTSVNKSPHVLSIFGIDPYYSSAYFSVFVEFASGDTLTKYMASHSRNTGLAIQFCREIIWALVYLDSLQILHNDLKCDNLLIFIAGGRLVVKVADFGRAIFRFEKVTRTGSRRLEWVIGTRRWAPPEFIAPPSSGAVIGPTSDIYMFGFVVACLAVWGDPFKDLTKGRMTQLKGIEGGILQVLPQEIKEEGAWSSELLEKCLQKKPKHRWQTASAMLSARGFTSEQSSTETIPTTTSSVGSSRESVNTFSFFLDAMETVNFSTVLETLKSYSPRDSLRLLDQNPKENLEVDELILQSCCSGLGIGVARDTNAALGLCLKAGLQGDVSARLTSIILYDTLSKYGKSAGVPDIQAVYKWRQGYISELPNEGGRRGTSSRCSMTHLFKSTPAARSAIQKYPALSAAIKGCTCASSAPTHAFCGWSLLSRLQELQLDGAPAVAMTGYRDEAAELFQTAVDFRDSKCNTLLHFVAVCKTMDESILVKLGKFLIFHCGENLLSICNQEGDSVIRLAGYAGNWKLATSLLRIRMDTEVLKEMCLEAIAAASWQTLNDLLRVSTGTEHAPDIDGLLLSLCAVPMFQREITSSDVPNTEGMEVLMKYGANVRCHDGQNRTTLALAATANNTDYVEFILKQIGCFTPGETDVAAPNEHDHPICFAREAAFLNQHAVDGETALSGAIRNGNARIVQGLLDLNVEVEWRTCAPTIGVQETWAILIAYQAYRYLKNDGIIQLIQSRHPQAVHVRDPRGRSILHYLAAGDNEADTTSCMQKALESGLSYMTRAQDDQGFTPLHNSVVGGVARNVDFLLTHGSDPTIVDSRGYTVLHLAVEDYGQENYPVLNEFFKQSADTAVMRAVFDSQDLWGRTALMHAAGKFLPPKLSSDGETLDMKGVAALSLLLKKSSPVSLQLRDRYGQTALHHFYGRCATLVHEGKNPDMVIEELETIYRDICPVADYGGYEPQEFFEAKLDYLKNDKMPKLRRYALWDKIFWTFCHLVIFGILIVIDLLLSGLFIFVCVSNEALSPTTRILTAGIIVGAIGFCLYQTTIQFLQVREKIRSGINYDGAFKQDYGEVFTNHGEQIGNQASVEGLERGRRYLASFSFRDGPHWAYNVGAWEMITAVFAGFFHWDKHEGRNGVIWILIYCVCIGLVTLGLALFYERSTSERSTKAGAMMLAALVLAGYGLDRLYLDFRTVYMVTLFLMMISGALLCGFGGRLMDWIEARHRARNRQRNDDIALAEEGGHLDPEEN